MRRIFNRDIKKIQRDRAILSIDYPSYCYLHDEVARRLVDRLQDIQRDFPQALDLGCRTGHIYEQLRNDPGIGGIEKLFQCDASDIMTDAISSFSRNVGSLESKVITADEELDSPIHRSNLDMVISSMSLHWVNDIPGTLKCVRESLKPDGVFLASMLGGETLRELRSSFILAEQERLGGVSNHVSPFADISDVGKLLQEAGFALPTVDTDYIQVNYADAFELMEHLRAMAENKASFSTKWTSGETFMAMASIYHELYGNPDGTIPATFQVFYMIGWSPADSQPRPLPRGRVEGQRSFFDATTR